MQSVSIFVALFWCVVCESHCTKCDLPGKKPEAHTSVSMAGPFWENLDLFWTRGTAKSVAGKGDVEAKSLRRFAGQTNMANGTNWKMCFLLKR